MSQIQEGYIPFKGYKTYYRIIGEQTGKKLPLLALHGGPGCGHSYLITLDELATHYGRQVIYYDQLGCGKSQTPSMPDFWCEELWEEEIDVVRKALKLDQIHLLGQSWGGMLAMRYAIHQPSGIASMVIASSPSSMDLWVSEAKQLRALLPEDMQQALEQADEDGRYDRPEVIRASEEYYRRHVCKLNPYPDFVAKSFDGMGEPYQVMQGASEFVCTGKMKTYNVTDQLYQIRIPTLVTSGSMDEATPLISKTIYDRIPDCEWELFAGGTHLCHVEYAQAYNARVERFFSAHE